MWQFGYTSSLDFIDRARTRQVNLVRIVRFSCAISPPAEASGSSLRWRASPASSVVRQAKLPSGSAPRYELLSAWAALSCSRPNWRCYLPSAPDLSRMAAYIGTKGHAGRGGADERSCSPSPHPRSGTSICGVVHSVDPMLTIGGRIAGASQAFRLWRRGHRRLGCSSIEDIPKRIGRRRARRNSFNKNQTDKAHSQITGHRKLPVLRGAMDLLCS